MKKTIIILAFIMFASITGPVWAQSEKINQKKIQGTWQVIECIICGEYEANRTEIDKVIFKGDKLIYTLKGGQAGNAFKLKNVVKLRVVDQTSPDNNSRKITPNTVYLFKEDISVLCIDDFNSRSTGFDFSEEQNSLLCLKLKRIKK